MKIEAKTEPSEDGHGYVAVVKINNKIVYNSESKFAQKGVFEDVHDAQAHADAWALAEQDYTPRIDDLRQDRRNRYAGEVLVLTREAADDLVAADKHRKAAKMATENAAARGERVKLLAHATENPRVRIEWDRKTSDGVKLVVEASEWDSPFEPDLPEDDGQLSLPQVNWKISEIDGELTAAIGYGRVEIEVVDGEIRIKLGADEHRIAAVVTGKVVHFQQRASTTSSKPVEIKMGKLKDKQLRERIARLTRAETLLGLYALELERPKPRAKVLAALDDLAADHPNMQLAVDMSGLSDGRPSTGVKPDRAAAALVSLSGVPEIRDLEQLVPLCEDPIVINDLLDDERERGEQSRDEVEEVLRQRLAELAPTVESASEVANEAPVVH